GGGVEAVPSVAELGGHQAAKVVGGGVAAEPVGIGEKVALERGGLRVKILDHRGVPGGGHEFAGREEAKLLRGSGDVEEVAALRDGEFVIEDIAAGDAADDIHGACGAVE